MSRVLTLFDPLVRLLLLAILLASFVPVSGAAVPIARIVLDSAIFLLFLLNGLRLPRAEVMRGMRNWRFLLPLAVFVFGVMGFIGWSLVDLASFALPASVALGFAFLGVLPSTVQSATAYTSIAKGNVANSVVAAATLNILGVFISAPIIALMASADAGAAGIDLDGLQRLAMILLLPFAIGQMLQGKIGKLVTERKALVSWMDRIAIAVAVYVGFSSAVEQGIWTQIAPVAWAMLFALILLMLAIGFSAAWWLSGLLRFELPDRIAFLFAGAQKSIAMGAPLAAVLFTPETAGLVLLPLLLYHLLQMVISAPLANRFSQQMP